LQKSLDLQQCIYRRRNNTCLHLGISGPHLPELAHYLMVRASAL